MALANGFHAVYTRPTPILPTVAASFPYPLPTSFGMPTKCLPLVLQAKRKTNVMFSQCFATKNELSEVDNGGDDVKVEEVEEPSETLLYSFTPLPLLVLAALPGVELLCPGCLCSGFVFHSAESPRWVHGPSWEIKSRIDTPAGTVRSLFGPFVELVKSWNLPDWLVHWGHPGNMAVVLFAMGGYGTYLGFRIRYSDDVEEKAKAKDLHPKLLGGMFFFFALGATGGVTSLLTSDKPIFESPHAVTGFIGLTLLTIQTILPTLFEGKPGLRNVHGILGSGIMALFLIHAALGLQLGLSY
ncbi:hypothetical protein CXB51_002492 [Gossypium anomalum]|uniref:Uncharacterized protein n=1 Tax=Gossypium anomalum TaxID=47600 RepID=A0A8J6DDR7_9ROSI|nr:hypothetical protein CXB51_002492 [Gossypium anomalum]